MTTAAPHGKRFLSRRRGRRAQSRAPLAVLAVAVTAGAVAAGLALGGAGVPTPVAVPAAVSTEQVKGAISSGRLLFVGASYTVGLGATTPALGYAPVAAHRLDRGFTVAAASGTGFLNAGRYHQGTFAQRIERVPPDVDPRIVLIQGGRNDAAYPPAQVLAAARSTICLARSRFAHAQVVVMGPIPAFVPVGPNLLRTRDAVQAAARQSGAGFIDPIAERWITAANEKGYAGPVAYHPNDAGYRYIAARLLTDLPAALERSAPPDATRAPSVPGGTGGTGGTGAAVDVPSAEAVETPADDAHLRAAAGR